MLGRNEGTKEKLTRKLPIAVKGLPRPDPSSLHTPPDARQVVPRHVWIGVMCRMQIVVQKDQRPERMCFDHVRSKVRLIVGTMLRERTQMSDR